MKKIVVTLLLAAILLTVTPMSATLAEASYATVQSGNQYGVRLRLGPGTNYASQTTLPSGTVVTVLEQGTIWTRIQAGTLIMHQRVYAADEEQIADVREGYRLYQLTPPKKRHHRLSMEDQVKKAGAERKSFP